MKKVMLGLLIAVLMFVGAGANTLTQNGMWPLSRDWCVRTVTLTSESVVGTITVPGYVVSLNIQSKGGDTKWSKAGTTTEAWWTIGQDQTFYDHYAIPLASAEVLYFKPQTSTTTTVEALFNIR